MNSGRKVKALDREGEHEDAIIDICPGDDD